MNLNRIIVILAVLVAGALVASTSSFAGKPDKPCSPWPACKNDGGDPPPPPPPTGCTDTFPGFLYQVEATRKLPAELRIASTDACRTEHVVFSSGLRAAAFHMTLDRSAGVIVWSEDHDNQYIVRRLDFTVDFTVDPSGILTVGAPVTVLPLAVEEPLQGDYRFYMNLDVWGDATHNSLILAIGRGNVINSGPDSGASTDETMIYDLHDLTGDLSPLTSPDVRVLFRRQKGAGGDVLEFGTWLDAGSPASLPDCFFVPYPQFVPTCYRAAEFRFNPSGTRLYFERNSTGDFTSEPGQWHGVQRIHIDKTDGPLAGWSLTGPELVYTAGPSGVRPRPDNDPLDLPSPEIVTAGGQILNADDCTDDYAPFADGSTELPADFWRPCIVDGLLAHGNAKSWESPDSYLFDRLSQQGRGRYNIYRVYVSGGLADTEELLIETARHADTGQ
ncbi:exported protein of unknown function [uncultured Woeseiaceae bacterium]|uniref:Uncharacterized protein n=1 Tax=uncultured Woeseiaceae bacterium TaxID=1983305 RepID=A0A7D9H586_9GAMM|nr:exported protein of unknown function [uncultured Woeseiaceae bacterium]